MPQPLRILVSGMVAQQPMAGQACHYLQYVLGLRDLGHDVYYVEDNGAPPYDPVRQESHGDVASVCRYMEALFGRFGLGGRWAYMNWDGTYHGISTPDALRLYETADVLLNVSGTAYLVDRHLEVPVRAYIDTDPHGTHIKHAQGQHPQVDLHTHRFTFGTSYGRPGCRLPVSDKRWIPTRQPIHLPLWRGLPPHPPVGAPYNTVSNWSSYATIEYEGEVYGNKEASFLKLIDLPKRVSRPVEVALPGINLWGREPADLLRSHGWRVAEGADVTGTLDAYMAYIAAAHAEIGIAKDGYIKTRSGWFSERSACYLAAGRPVVAQDTGWSQWIGELHPIGEGVFPIEDVEDAARADAALAADWPRHAAAAQACAERVFDARRVLTEMLDHCT